MAESFAVFDAVGDVLDLELTSARWAGCDDYERELARCARAFLEEQVETGVLINHGNDPSAAGADFKDLRDYVLWQWAVDMVLNRCTCRCERHL